MSMQWPLDSVLMVLLFLGVVAAACHPEAAAGELPLELARNLQVGMLVMLGTVLAVADAAKAWLLLLGTAVLFAHGAGPAAHVSVTSRFALEGEAQRRPARRCPPMCIL